MSVDVFDMFGGDDESSDRTALATAPGRESVDPAYDAGPGRRGGRTLIALVVTGVLVAGLVGAVSWFIGRRLSSEAPVVSCSTADRADQARLRNWLQLHTDSGLAGQTRQVAAIGCAPGEAAPGAWVAIVDADELKGMVAVLAEADCELAGTDPTRSADGRQTCTVDVDGLAATLTVARAAADSPYGDFEITAVRKPTPSGA